MLQGIKYGIDLINDVSGFTHEKNSLHKLKNFKVAKVLHHMQGTPNTMQKNPKYKMFCSTYMISLRKTWKKF